MHKTAVQMRSVDEEVEDVIGRLKAAVGVSLFDASAARGGPSLFDRVYDADVPRGTVDDDWDPVPSPTRRDDENDDDQGDEGVDGRANGTANYLHRSATDDEVRGILANLYRVATTGGPIPEDLKEPSWDDRELPRWDPATRAKWDPRATKPYVMEGVMPPWHAKSYYKVVAAVPEGAVRASTSERAAEVIRRGATRGDTAGDNTAGVEYVSIYDGVTRYRPGVTVCHPAKETHGGGLYVAETIEGCLRRDAEMFPTASAMLNAPRAIARVRCWNPDRLEEPVRYGGKLAFTCCHVDEILPYPTTWGAGIKGAGTRTWSAAADGGPTTANIDEDDENDENARVGDANSSSGFRYSVFSPSRPRRTRMSYDDAALDEAAGGMFRGMTRVSTGTPGGLRGVARRSTEARRSTDAGSGLGELVDDEAAAIVAELEARAVAGVQAAGRRREAERVGAGGKVAEAETKGAERLLRAQAKTVTLEEEVRAMERRLDRARYGA